MKILKKISNKLKIDLIIGLGSGTINDLCVNLALQIKYFLCNFASAASMNGYLSKMLQLLLILIKNFNSNFTRKVFCNLNILRNAPVELTKSWSWRCDVFLFLLF